MSRQQSFSKEYGEISFSWGENHTGDIKLNKLAHTIHGELLAVSMITEQIRVKQIRAALTSNDSKKVRAFVSDCRTNEKGRDGWMARTPGILHLSAEGYIIYSSKLGYGLAHCLLVTKTPGFMMVANDDTLWTELKSSRFTTPLLREWVPYIATKLREIGRLYDAYTLNCQCGALTVTTQKLDEIVIAGITSGEIAISPVVLAA
jgi:hypothetical protein